MKRILSDCVILLRAARDRYRPICRPTPSTQRRPPMMIRKELDANSDCCRGLNRGQATGPPEIVSGRSIPVGNRRSFRTSRSLARCHNVRRFLTSFLGIIRQRGDWIKPIKPGSKATVRLEREWPARDHHPGGTIMRDAGGCGEQICFISTAPLSVNKRSQSRLCP